VQLDAQVRWKNGEMAMKPGIWSGIKKNRVYCMM
jgi:hypothetical protein